MLSGKIYIQYAIYVFEDARKNTVFGAFKCPQMYSVRTLNLRRAKIVKTKAVQIKLPIYYYNIIKQMVNAGMYKSIAEFCSLAAREKAQKEARLLQMEVEA